MQNIVVAGGGVLGSQIAIQSAYFGKNVVIWGRETESIEKARKRVDQWVEEIQEFYGALDSDMTDARKRISYSTDLGDATVNAELVIESVAENIEVKKDFYSKLSEVLSENTLIATNSSTLLPSTFAKYTGRPDKFISLHFANHIWAENLVEIMSQSETTSTTVSQVQEFAVSIGMVPVMVQKEQPGYLLNSMLVPWLTSALLLWGKGVGSVEDIDRTWMIAKDAAYGPFGNMDRVGLNTVLNIVTATLEEMPESVDKRGLANAVDQIQDLIESGNIGVESGQGFYTYPHPEFESDDFLKGVTKN